MSISTPDVATALASNVRVTRELIEVTLHDGRLLAVPVDWYPRLASAKPTERARWRLIGRGEGIHWPDLDEDISVAGLLGGRRSAESAASLRRWRASRKR